MKHFLRRLTNAGGFTIMDVLATLAIMATVTAIAAPQAYNAVDRMRLGMEERDVERELQYARLKAVSSNTVMRVRFDCPTTGQLRAVELIGTPALPDTNDADTYLSRCDENLYPYRPAGAGESRLVRPANDGAIRTLDGSTTFASKETLEFWPDGSVHADMGAGNPWPSIGMTGAVISLSRKGQTKNIQVNGLGKILMDR